jgi:chemotaxis protein methyltransferase CheR
MDNKEIEKIEIDLLLIAINKRYGYDFTNYAQASLKRRLSYAKTKLNLECYADLIPKLLHDEKAFKRFLTNLSVPVTEMFRDPDFYINFREKVIPVLETYPFIKIWVAGCATGEEVYSLAILFKESGLLERTQFYATDINDDALNIATKGIYSLDSIKKYTENYNKVSNKSSFSEYYHAKYDSVIMGKDLKKHITFSHHNLVSDHHFGEMNVISCRNVLIYFDLTLQNIVLKKYRESLINRGFLCLGNKESLMNSKVCKSFEKISKEQRIYRLQNVWVDDV